MQSSLRLWLVAILAAFVSLPAFAKDFTEKDVPDPLKPWISWVLHEYEPRDCPFIYNSVSQPGCIWPGKLSLALNGDGGSFTYNVTVYKKDWVRLPGSSEWWPQSVTSGGNAAPVLPYQGWPSLYLQPGSYEIAGKFLWDSLPQNLPLPQEAALVELSVNGEKQVQPSVENGGVWLRAVPAEPTVETKEQDALQLQLFRHLVDSMPFMVETRIHLKVSGKSREQVLPTPLLPDFTPMQIYGGLPAKLETDGKLRVQLKPGEWDLTIVGRREGPIADITLPEKTDSVWPNEELWSFEGVSALRLVRIEGVDSIDPSQTDLPQEWASFPTYHMKAGDAMQLVEQQRGAAQTMPDTLSIQRSWWLDFDGKGYTVRDSVSGQIQSASRLSVQGGMMPGRVSINGQDQYITTLPGQGESVGVEVRQGPITLEADSRMEEARSSFSATGWKADFQTLRGTLFLPPGWSLFAQQGVDAAYPSWISGWTLHDIFLVVITGLIIYKLLSPVSGLLATFGLVLLHPVIPAFTVASLLLLACLALLRVLPEGKFSRFVSFIHRMGLIAVAIALVPFVILHLREAIYPQLKSYYTMPMFGGAAQMGFDDAAMAPPMMDEMRERDIPMAPPPPAALPMPSEAMSLEEGSIGLLKSKVMRANKMSSYGGDGASSSMPQQQLYQYMPDRKVQTGFGIPRPTGNSVNLIWNGTVAASQQIDLWLISPAMNLVFSVLRVLLLGAVLLALLGIPLKPGWRSEASGSIRRVVTFSLLLIALASVVPSAAFAAETDAEAFPPQPLLDEMKNRLLETLNKPPACDPVCGDVTRLQAEAKGNQLVLLLEAHAKESISLPLPGGASNWRPDAVTVDGSAGTLRQADDGYLHVSLTEGVHKVEMIGTLPSSRAQLSIALPVMPHYSSASGEGWEIAGIREDGKTDGSLQFIRTGTAPVSAAGEDSGPAWNTELPPYLQVDRTLTMGVNWQVTTSVRRISPPGHSVFAEIPLLPGERPLRELNVVDGKARVQLAPDEMETSWTSDLKDGETFTFTAPTGVAWSEIWRVSVSNLWHVEFEGIPRINTSIANGEMPTYQPWAGETLTLKVIRPEGVQGMTETIDRSSLSVSVSQRVLDATLDFTLRSSQGGQHKVTLPERAKVKSIMVNGNSIPPREEAVISLPIVPGSQQVNIQWSESQETPMKLTLPKVDLHIPSTVNADVSVSLPQDRWVLFAHGPSQGPAILLWSWIPAILLFSFALMRTGLTPLKLHHWFLLFLGLSQSDVMALMLVAGWLLWIGLRVRMAEKPMSNWRFNLCQIALAMMTVIALSALLDSIREGLLGYPDMKIAGNGSSAYYLKWFADITDSTLPQPWVVSVDILWYRLLMLAWALWLAFALLRWLRWGWESYSGGGLWRRTPKAPKTEKTASA